MNLFRRSLGDSDSAIDYIIFERQKNAGSMEWTRQDAGDSGRIEQSPEASKCPILDGSNNTCFRAMLDWAWYDEKPLCDRINSCASRNRSIVAVAKARSQTYPEFDEYSTSGVASESAFISCQ